MNEEVSKRLKKWRADISNLEGVERYRIIQNKTLDDIAMLLPKTKDELLAIKGIREKKFEKYGRDILAIIHECVGSDHEEMLEEEPDLIYEEIERVYSVSDFLDLVNSSLSRIRVAVRGEVSSINFQKHLYFSLKDKNDGSVVN